MSPASNRHGRLQGVIYSLLEKIGHGRALIECSIDTPEGVKVADVAWGSEEFFARHGYTTPYPEAPEICVEIRSPSNGQGDNINPKHERRLVRSLTPSPSPACGGGERLESLRDYGVTAEEEMRFKTRLYLQAGAREVWIILESGEARFFGPEGERSQSEYGIDPRPHLEH